MSEGVFELQTQKPVAGTDLGDHNESAFTCDKSGIFGEDTNTKCPSVEEKTQCISESDADSSDEYDSDSCLSDSGKDDYESLTDLESGDNLDVKTNGQIASDSEGSPSVSAVSMSSTNSSTSGFRMKGRPTKVTDRAPPNNKPADDDKKKEPKQTEDSKDPKKSKKPKKPKQPKDKKDVAESSN